MSKATVQGLADQMSYQQQGSYGYGAPQQGGYGHYPPPPPPKKSNTGVIVAVAVVAVAAIVAVVLVLVLNGDDGDKSASDRAKEAISNGPVIVTGPGAAPKGGAKPQDGGAGGADSARALADKAAKIIERHATSEVDGVACNSTAASKLKTEMGKIADLQIKVTVEDVTEQGDDAVAKLKLTRTTDGKSDGYSLRMSKQGGDWCLAGK